MKTIGLIGLGAVGALYGERLLSSGAELVVIVDEARRERYMREGVEVNGVRIDFPYATPDQGRPLDLVIFATKDSGIPPAMETAAPFIGKDTLLICLTNGVTSEGMLEERFGKGSVLYSVAQGMDAVKTGGRLTYSLPGTIVLGEREPGRITARVREVEALLGAHGVKVTPVDDMVRRQWSKLMFNVGLNQAVMVFEGDYGMVQREGRAREVMITAMREAQAIAALEGFPIGDEEFDAWLRMLASFSPKGKPSMRQDGEAHRKSEVELFSGTIRRLAKKHGAEVPVNDWLYARVKEMEAAY